MFNILYTYYLYLKLDLCAFLTGANGGDSLITVSSSELVSMQSPSSWSALANHHGLGIGGGGGVGGHHQMPPMNPTRISPQPALIPTACMGGQMSPTSAAYYQPRQTHPPYYTWYWSPRKIHDFSAFSSIRTTTSPHATQNPQPATFTCIIYVALHIYQCRPH